MARSLTSLGMSSSKRRKPRDTNEAICFESSKYFLSTMSFLQLFKYKFVFVKRGCELRAGIGWNQLRKLDDAPACFEGIHTAGIRRFVAVAGGVVFAACAVINRPTNHFAIEG